MCGRKRTKGSHQIEGQNLSSPALPAAITAAAATAACLAEQRFGRAGQAREKAAATHRKKRAGERQSEKERRNSVFSPKEEKRECVPTDGHSLAFSNDETRKTRKLQC